MTTRGPGGRQPSNQAGRPITSPGVGANSNRSDLQKTPGQRDSDLQQGDVQAMEAGQQIQPIQEQRPAAPKPRTGGQGRTAGPEGQRPNISEVAKSRLGGSLNANSSTKPPDPRMENLSRSWGNFLRQLAKDPNASPLFRARAQITAATLNERGAFSRSSLNDMSDVDDEIDTFLTQQGF